MFFGPWWDDDQALSFFGGPLAQGGAAADGSPPTTGAADGDADPNEQLTQAGQPDPKFATFFGANYPAAAHVAAKYGIDPTLLLGVAALESSYGTSKDAKDQNNPLGMRPDGHTPTAFPSTDAAWDAWGREFGPRVLGVGSDAATFLDRLQEDHRQIFGPTRGGDYRGPYNSEKVQPGEPTWRDKVAGAIAGVRRRLPLWQGNSDSGPDVGGGP